MMNIGITKLTFLALLLTGDHPGHPTDHPYNFDDYSYQLYMNTIILENVHFCLKLISFALISF